MAYPYQLPTLYLRGSLANETLKKLKPEQREIVSALTEKIVKHPEMVKHRVKFYKTLKHTIGGDYKDIENADADYTVGVWQGVAMLLYHKSYKFKCSLCGASEYTTSNEHKKPIQSIRQKNNKCPACKKTAENGESPIIAEAGDEKYPDPYAILDDEDQISKFFGHLLSNLSRQQLRENVVKTTTRTYTMTDFANKIVILNIKKILQKHKISFQESPTRNIHGIYFDVNALSAGCIGHLLQTKRLAVENNVKYETKFNGIEISQTDNTNMLTNVITEKVSISVLSPSQAAPTENNAQDNLNSFDYESSDLDHTLVAELQDTINQVRDLVPHKHCIDVYEIFTQKGEVYEEYREKYGEKYVKKNVEKFLGITPYDHDLRWKQLTAQIHNVQRTILCDD